MNDKLIKLLFLKVNKLRKIGKGVSGFPYMDLQIGNYADELQFFYREKGFPTKSKGKREWLSFLSIKNDNDLLEAIAIANKFLKKGKDLKKTSEKNDR